MKVANLIRVEKICYTVTILTSLFSYMLGICLFQTLPQHQLFRNHLWWNARIFLFFIDLCMYCGDWSVRTSVYSLFRRPRRPGIHMMLPLRGFKPSTSCAEPLGLSLKMAHGSGSLKGGSRGLGVRCLPGRWEVLGSNPLEGQHFVQP